VPSKQSARDPPANLLDADQVALAQQFYDAGEKTVQQIADLFGVPRTTVYGHLVPSSKGKRPTVAAPPPAPADAATERAATR